MISNKSQITILANRLPIYYQNNKGWQLSPGGLARVVQGLTEYRLTTWVGWAGRSKPHILTDKNDINGQKLSVASHEEIYLSQREMTHYYEGYCNRGLWPLYHNACVDECFKQEDYQVYSEVNQRFAYKAAEVAPKGSSVWVHDYQLQLVPLMLRRLRDDLRIGFFLHIPFPRTEIFASIPFAKEILEGILGADLIGFQAKDHADNFLSACSQLTCCKIESSCVQVSKLGGLRKAHVEVFPVGVNAKNINALAGQREIRDQAKQIRRELGNPKILLLGVDRLDYTKGIDVRMKAVAELFASGHLDPDSTILRQISMVTRESISTYRKLAEETQSLANSLNAQIGKAGRQCIRYSCETLEYNDLIANYLASSMMLVTPYCDGMNIVCKEYVATREDCSGSLVLSQFAGAASQMKSAWLVNPYKLESVKAGIIAAVGSSKQERSERMNQLRRDVFEYDSKWWADTFLRRLSELGG